MIRLHSLFISTGFLLLTIALCPPHPQSVCQGDPIKKTSQQLRQILSVSQWLRFESALDHIELSALPASLNLSEQQWRQLEQIQRPACEDESLPKNDHAQTIF
ncbi:MAG: hypothetical protein H7Y37_19590 [Anaerolineae bacterium]|nr:hypothetical protein [Gloeobacterales cyanobacterium ES-bin-313]